VPQYVTYKDPKGKTQYRTFLGQYVIKPRGMYRIGHDFENSYFKNAIKLGESTAEQARAAIASFADLESMQEEKVELLELGEPATSEPETIELTAEEQKEIAEREVRNAEYEKELDQILTLTHIRPEEYTALQTLIDAMPKRGKTERPAAESDYYLPVKFFERMRADADLQHLQAMLQEMFASRNQKQCFDFLTELAARNHLPAIAHYIPRQPSIAHAFSLLMCTIKESLNETEQTTMALHYEKVNNLELRFDFGESLNSSVASHLDATAEMFSESTTTETLLDESDCRQLRAVQSAIAKEYRDRLEAHSKPETRKGWFSFFNAGCAPEEKEILDFWAPTFERGNFRGSSIIDMINKYHQTPPRVVLNAISIELGFSHLPILMREESMAMHYMVIRELVYRGAQDKDVRYSLNGLTVFNQVVAKARRQLAGHEAEFNRLISRALAQHPEETTTTTTTRMPLTTESLAVAVYDRDKAAKEVTAISSLSSRGTIGNGFANGLKVGELHDSSPLITRLATDPTWRIIKEETLISDIEKELPPHMVAILNLMFPDGKLPAGLSIPAEPSTMPTDQEIMGDVNNVVASLMHLGNPSISYYDQYLENLNQDDNEIWGMFSMVIATAVAICTLGAGTPLMAAAIASGTDAGLQALGMAVGATHKFNIMETIAAGLGAAVGSGAGRLTGDLLGKGGTFLPLLTERVAAAAAQNATSQLTRFALSGGDINFSKKAFYSAIATAAASAAIEFNLGGNEDELSTLRNKYAREQVRAKMLGSIAGEGIDAAINHRDLKLDRLIANAITTGIKTAAETSDIRLGISHKVEPKIESQKGGSINRYQEKTAPTTKQTSASQGIPVIMKNAGSGTYAHYTGEGEGSSDIHSVYKSEGDLVTEEFYHHWDYYLPTESSLTPSINIGSGRPTETIYHQLQQQRAHNPGALHHQPESSKWDSFNHGFWNFIDATNRSYEHTMASFVATGKAVKTLYEHPSAIVNGIEYLYSHPGEVVAKIGSSIDRTATKFIDGDINTKYEMILNGISDNVTGSLIGGAAVKATTTAAAAGTKLVGATLTQTKSAGLLLAGIIKTGEKVPNGGTVNHMAHNAADALRQRTVLRLREGNILDSHGKLTSFAIDESKHAMNPNAVLKNLSVVRELTKDGSHITDWQKMTTPSVEMHTGQRIQVHYYRNKVTGEINYTHQDFKVKGTVDLYPRRPTPEPMIQPPYRP
jgi:hypothetical protein